MPLAADAPDRFARDWRALTRERWSEPALVAVSGGADSMALLLLLHAVPGARCHAATVDHRLRPEAAAEAAGVAAFCRSRGIAHRVLTGAMPDRVDGSANLSARARALRYALLREHAIALEATWIATAHHADDQLETMVMRLNRGSGVGGLAGIRRREQDAGGATVVRPLLGWRHAELAALVSGEGVAAVDDPSNADDRFDRARLRKRLATVDWLDPVAAARSAAALGDAEEALRWAVDRERRDSCAFGPEEATMRFTVGPAELRRRLVVACLRHVDPAVSPRGGEVDRLITALDAGETATLGDVRCSPLPGRTDDRSPPSWTFQRAPPRRAP